MYILDPSLTSIDLQDKAVLTLIQSINQPMVAAGDYPAEETQAFIVTVQSKNRALASFIYLHLLENNRCLIYRAEQSPYMGDRLEEVESQGLEFVESMGFMMDDLRYSRLARHDQEVLQRTIPIFFPDLQAFAGILVERREFRGNDRMGMEGQTGEHEASTEEVVLEVAVPMSPESDPSVMQPPLPEVLEANVAGERFPAASPIATGSADTPALVSAEATGASEIHSLDEGVAEDEISVSVPSMDSELEEFFAPKTVSASSPVPEKVALPVSPPRQAQESDSEASEGKDFSFAKSDSTFVLEPKEVPAEDLSQLREIEESLAKGAVSDDHVEASGEVSGSVAPGILSDVTPEQIRVMLRLLLTL